jgi:hypothetical protein
MKRFWQRIRPDLPLIAAIAAAVLIFLVALRGGAQTQEVHPNPDCQFFFSFTTAGAQNLPARNGFDNRQQGCNTWSLSYNNYHFSPVSVTLQTAANNNGTAGSWGTGFPVQQTIAAGANPATNTTGGYLWIVGQNAFVRVRVAGTGTGIVSGAAFGWRIPNAQ